MVRAAFKVKCDKTIKAKLLPKCNLGFFYECIWVKPSCKSIIMTEEALSRFTVVSFSGRLIFNGVLRDCYANIKITIFKTLRRLDKTWNFACSITRVSTHLHEHWEHWLCTQIKLKRKFFKQLTLAVAWPTPNCHGSREVSISECNVNFRRVNVNCNCLSGNNYPRDISGDFSGF